MLSDKEAVEVLSTSFKSVFTVEDTSNIPDFPVRVDSQLNGFCITESDVLDALVALNPNKTPGPDNLHPQLLKKCAVSLARLLFTESLNSSRMPRNCKMANITLIFKKSSKTIPTNYRPVSLTSQVGKIIEFLIHFRIMRYLSENNIVTPYQHGFTTKKSCFTNLLETYENLTLVVDSGCGVDMIYLDYSKAFDSVPHYSLVKKLAGYGIGGKLLSWLTNFLQQLQRVVLNGENLEWV